MKDTVGAGKTLNKFGELEHCVDCHPCIFGCASFRRDWAAMIIPSFNHSVGDSRIAFSAKVSFSSGIQSASNLQGLSEMTTVGASSGGGVLRSEVFLIFCRGIVGRVVLQ